MRPSKIRNMMEIAEVVAKRSHDAQTQVGAVLVNNDSGAIIATGVNGFVRGANDKRLPNTRPEKYKYIVHSEINLIANCAKHGIAMENSTLICTMTPCVACMRAIYQAGVTKVIAKQKYSDYEGIKQMEDIEVSEVLTEDGFYELTYRPKD